MLRPGEVMRASDGKLYACVGYDCRGAMVMRLVVISQPTRPTVAQECRDRAIWQIVTGIDLPPEHRL